MAEPSPFRKRFLRISLILLAALALLFVSAYLALRSPGFRQSVLRQIASWLRTEYGLALKAADFDARWDGFSLDGVEVGAPDAKPVFRASRVDVSLDMRTLRGPVRVIRKLEIDDAVVDLSAPIPKLPESDPEAPPGFEIGRLVLRRGLVLGPPPEPPLSDWVRSWRIEEIEGGGSFVDGRWDVSVESSRAHVERPGFPPLDVQVGAQAEYKDGEPLHIGWVRATADGLRLTGSGSVGPDGASSRATFDAQLDPRLLVAGAPPGGSVRAKGELWLPDPVQGQVTVAARGVPAEILRPYLDTALFRDLSLAGTVADADADLELSPDVTGKGKVAWRRGDRQLVRMDLDVKQEKEIRLTAEGDLLPGSPGRRHVRGTLVAADWDVTRGTVERIDAELRLPDLSRAVAEIRALWPRLVPALPDEVRGALDADVRLSGKLDSPLAKVDATWLPEPGSRVKLQAEGRPITKTGSARAEIENLRLEQGVVSGTVSLSGSPRSYRTRVDGEVAQAAFPPYLESLERSRITGEGSLVLQPLSYTGTLDLDGTDLFARPNASSTARLASFQVRSNGTFKLEPTSYAGRLSFSGQGVDSPGLALAEQLNVESDGTFRLDPLSYQGTVSLDGTRIDVPERVRVERVALDANGTFSKTPEGRAVLDASGIQAADVTLVDLHAEASGDGKKVRVDALTGSLPEGRSFSASGSFTTDLQTADLDLRVVGRWTRCGRPS